MNEIIKGFTGEGDLSKYKPIIIIGVLIFAIYLLRKKGDGILSVLKEIPIAALLESK